MYPSLNDLFISGNLVRVPASISVYTKINNLNYNEGGENYAVNSSCWTTQQETNGTPHETNVNEIRLTL
jgi:hypothetical protein